MVEWRNEISGHVTGPVVQAGRIDQVVVSGVSHPEQAPLVWWRDRPALTPPLRDLLLAQQRATESLPYKLLGVKQPELTQVYVQQTMRPQVISPEPDHRTPNDSGERTLTISEALNRNGHLMITGEPGSGKSTVGYMYVRMVAEFWLSESNGTAPLTEPVLPLRIPARALADNKAWAELLAAGASEALGRLLSERPHAELFVRRALGARWLVFIDGLDEIIEPDTRAQVIEAIAHQIHRSADQRLVITTRPLPGNELKPLDRAGVETYAIQPFSPVELAEFAMAWFRAQNPITATTHAAEFVRQVSDGRLRDLVRNPLLATIAAIANTLEPDRQLPNSRVDLYARFMAYLLDDSASRRDPLSELRRTLSSHPLRLALVEWLHQHREEIVARLAVHRLETESPLLEAAYEWVRANHTDPPDSWQEDLRALLAATGVFVPTENDLRFRHHSFAEFLAARQRAGTIPADFPDLDVWIERGLDNAKQAFALFTFVLWGRENNDLGRVLTTLLAGTKDKVLLAGRLLAEEIAVDGVLADSVVERLMALLLANGARDNPWDNVKEIGQVLGSFLPRTLGEPVLTRLRELRDRPELAEAIRVECAAALGRLITPEPAVEWLEQFAETAGLAAVRRCAEVLKDLVPDGAEHTERVLVRMAERADMDCLITMAAISLLLDNGRTEASGRLTRSLCQRLRADGGILPLGSTRIIDDWDEHTGNWGNLADLAARSKCHDEALWAAGNALAQPGISAAEFRDAVDALLSAKGENAVTEILSAATTKPIDHLITAARALQEKRHSKSALELAVGAATRKHIDHYQFGQAARIFAMCGAVDELLYIVESNPHLGVNHTARISWLNPEISSLPPVKALTRTALSDDAIAPYEFSAVAKVVIDPDDRSTAEDIYRAAQRHSTQHRGRAVSVLWNAKYYELARNLITAILAEGVDVDTIIDLVTNLKDVQRLDSFDELLSAATPLITTSYYFQQAELIRTLAKAGRREEAIAAGRQVTIDNFNDQGLSDRVEAWLDVGGMAVAKDLLTETLSRDVQAKKRMEIADNLAAAGLLDAAVTMWLDVVRHHGEAVSQGVAATSCLVRCGYKDRVLATLDDTLADQRLTTPARTRLQALRAWVTT